MQSVKVIYTRLFRIYAIVYYHHYQQLGKYCIICGGCIRIADHFVPY